MRFTFAGTEYEGREGETLAAALVRNGVLGGFRSLYRDRPRGVYTAGEEEPNALVQIGARPMLRATLVELQDGLVAEPLAGKGRLRAEPDDRLYDTIHAHCDVLVVGAGRSGVAAAQSASGRVLLLDGREGTWVVGLYDDNYAIAVEHGRRVWRIRAKRIVLATGAIERPEVFPDNDRPGLMLANAFERYGRPAGATPVSGGWRPRVHLWSQARGRLRWDDRSGAPPLPPPSLPVSFALLAGRDRGDLFDPVRVTPIHPAHVEAGAVFEDVGQWKRPRYFPRDGEDMDAAVRRECAAARESVAKMDATTLGKIDVQGPDAVEFLNRMYTNAFDSLAVGRCRYAVLCRPDGMVFDDGVVMRVGEQRFVCTTTTGNAGPVLAWMEEWLQTEWPQLRVWLTSVTEQWATVAVVGPDSRELLAGLTAIPLDRESFPFMAIREGEVAGIRARVCRVSFSGELAYEVNVNGRRGLELWRAVDATPYGTEAMHVLRAEKGYPIVGQDTDGTVTPQDLGMDWIISKVKPDFVGKRSFNRADTARADRKPLVGLLPAGRVAEGTQLVASPESTAMLGYVTSSYDSVALGRAFALGLVERGRERIGETVYADGIAAEIVDSVLYDPEGARRDGRPA